MSYASRVYRHRNPKAQEESKDKPFFPSQKSAQKDKGNNSFFQAKSSIRRQVAGPGEEKKPDTASSMDKEKEKPVQSKMADQEKEREVTIPKQGDPLKERETTIQKKTDPVEEKDKDKPKEMTA
jgi:hypothetical protein